MAELNLTGQATAATDMKTKSTQLSGLLEQRKPYWMKMSVEQKKKWLSSNKDPVLKLAWDDYVYLKEFFMGVDNG